MCGRILVTAVRCGFPRESTRLLYVSLLGSRGLVHPTETVRARCAGPKTAPLPNQRVPKLPKTLVVVQNGDGYEPTQLTGQEFGFGL